MSVARTARRRRSQAANNYRHLSKMARPRFKKADPTKSARRAALKLANEKRMKNKVKS